MAEPRRTEAALRPQWLDQPRPDRFSPERPDYEAVMAAHAQAVANGSLGYMDPSSGLFAMTSVYLRDRGWCCDRGCRHCPYAEAGTASETKIEDSPGRQDNDNGQDNDNRQDKPESE
ncbi:MAG: DUF5522 domain-containing protein [Acidimicrobiales bacterium]